MDIQNYELSRLCASGPCTESWFRHSFNNEDYRFFGEIPDRRNCLTGWKFIPDLVVDQPIVLDNDEATLCPEAFFRVEYSTANDEMATTGLGGHRNPSAAGFDLFDIGYLKLSEIRRRELGVGRLEWCLHSKKIKTTGCC